MTAAAVARCEGRFRYPEIPPAGRATAPRGSFFETIPSRPALPEIQFFARPGTNPDEDVQRVSMFGIFCPVGRSGNAGLNLSHGTIAKQFDVTFALLGQRNGPIQAALGKEASAGLPGEAF
jgi:hypothetical protein